MNIVNVVMFLINMVKFIIGAITITRTVANVTFAWVFHVLKS